MASGSRKGTGRVFCYVGGQVTAGVNVTPITKFFKSPPRRRGGASESRTPLIIAPGDTPQLTLGAHKQPVLGDPLGIVHRDLKSPPRQRGGASESRKPIIIAPDDTHQLTLGLINSRCGGFLEYNSSRCLRAPRVSGGVPQNLASHSSSRQMTPPANAGGS